MMLSLEGVVKDFDGLRAVDGVSLDVPAGTIVGLIGPNGSGKSTLLNVIAGLTPATRGTIRFQGEDVTRLGPEAIFQRGLVRGFQDPSLFFQMTVLDNVLLPIQNQRGEHPWHAPWRASWKAQEDALAEQAAQVLDQVGLREHYGQLASDLSGGQMKLAELARSLTGGPKMLILDEPTAGVAPKLAYQIFEHMESLRSRLGLTFLIVEHRLEMLFDFVDLVYVMHLGRLLTKGTPQDITGDAHVREVYFGDA